jgi:23S rRNA maturation mini-RNase III
MTKYPPQATHIKNWCRYLKRSFSKLSKKIRNRKPTTKEIAMRRRSSYSKTTSNLI